MVRNQIVSKPQSDQSFDLWPTKERVFYALGTLKDSWVLTIRRFFPLFLSWALSLFFPFVLLALGLFFGLMADHMADREVGIWTLSGLLVPGALIGWMWAGWNLVCLKVARGIEVRWTDLFRPVSQILSALVVLVLSSTCISLLSLLVVPGALLFLKWQLAPFYIVDRNYGPIQALNASWRDTDRVFVPLALLDLAFFGLNTVTAPLVFGPVLCCLAMGVASALVFNKWLADEAHPDLKVINQDPSAKQMKALDDDSELLGLKTHMQKQMQKQGQTT